ncbi:MAG: TIGR03086 family metal-binding protein [Chloroflexota bacterium]|nr:TIGR03086 family metal-binding protein [Rhodospirillaceae bacterium]MDE2787378.1 TIGR03086 family metal-binding protein [Chloroflexota bacterium]MDE2962173.1 TIGR03086 family metal-binding protein [Chloroflexota bacterium]
MAAEAQMPDPVAQLERVTRRTKEVASGVTQAQATDATPCSQWSVLDLFNHLIGGLEFTAGCITGSVPDIRPNEAESSYQGETDVAVLIRAYHAAVDRALELAAGPGALERTAMTPFGEMPVARIMMGTVMDQLVHCWDLARATGQDTTLNSEMVEFAYGMLVSGGFADMGRQAGFVGPEVAVPDSASMQDRMIAYMGRQP